MTGQHMTTDRIPHMLYDDPPVSPASTEFLCPMGAEQVRCHAGRYAELSIPLGVPLGVDIESFGLGRFSARLKCVSFSDGHSGAVLDPRDPLQRNAITMLINQAPGLIFHNSTFDVPNLARNGLFRAGLAAKVTDTLIYSRLAEPDSRVQKSLAAVGKRYLSVVHEDYLAKAFRAWGLKKSEGYALFDLDRPLYLLGAVADAVLTARLVGVTRRAALRRLTTGHPFTQNGVTGTEAAELVEREQRLNRVFLRRAIKGLRTDLDYLDAYRERTAVELQKAEDELTGVGIRPGNANDLIAHLEEQGALPDGHPRTKKTQRPSTVAADLERLAHPVARVYLGHKQTTKILNDYLTKVEQHALTDGRIYPTTNVLAAATGRASMSDPPLHQFSADARGIVLSDEGDQFTSLDWAQIEPVVAANIAGDVDVVVNYEGGGDFYLPIVEYAGITRNVAKVVLLAQMYGEGIGKLARDLGITEDDARGLRAKVFDAMPKMSAMLSKLRAIAKDHRCVFTLSGRIVPIPVGPGWTNPETGEQGSPGPMAHKGPNYFVQGSAYDVLADTVLRGEAEGLGDTLYLTMHDELVVSTDAAPEWERIMQAPPARLIELAKRVPTLRTDRHDLGERWAKV